jgi:hypothetical protein
LSGRLGVDFSLPGQPGQEAEKELEQTYGTNSSSPFIPVVTVPQGRTVEAEKARVGEVYEAIRQEVPGVRVVDFVSTNDPRFLTEDGAHGKPLRSPSPSRTSGRTPRIRQICGSDRDKGRYDVGPATGFAPGGRAALRGPGAGVAMKTQPKPGGHLPGERSDIPVRASRVRRAGSWRGCRSDAAQHRMRGLDGGGDALAGACRLADV